MERDRFDALTRIFATPGSRRAALAALAGALFAGSAVAEGKGRHGRRGRHGHHGHDGHHRPPGAGRSCDIDDDCPSAGAACCDGHCLDVSSDRDHCGSCTKQCGESEICSAGACVACDVCDKAGLKCAYRSIGEAIAAAKPISTIRICPGSYKERLRISKTVELIGLGDRPQDVELDGQNRLSRAAVVTVDPNVQLTARNLKITGGRTNNAQAGGGITNFGRLFLDAVHITDNDANSYNGGGALNLGPDAVLSIGGSKVTKNQAYSGGGVSNDQGRVTVVNSQIDNNEARSSGGGIHTRGGQIQMLPAASITGNSAPAGGGIQMIGGTVSMNGAVVVDRNKAREIGGGVNNFQGALVMSGLSGDSNAITDNRADRDGGGVFNNGGTVTLRGKSSIYGNDPNDCVNANGGTGCPGSAWRSG
ncbi:MAG TPA: hypothetical protein VFX03_13495 [Thermomicrobiales bacterium]|nr:hypothetical protein [Thermomicrobiales bacterium]